MHLNNSLLGTWNDCLTSSLHEIEYERYPKSQQTGMTFFKKKKIDTFIKLYKNWKGLNLL